MLTQISRACLSYISSSPRDSCSSITSEDICNLEQDLKRLDNHEVSENLNNFMDSEAPNSKSNEENIQSESARMSANGEKVCERDKLLQDEEVNKLEEQQETEKLEMTSNHAITEDDTDLFFKDLGQRFNKLMNQGKELNLPKDENICDELNSTVPSISEEEYQCKSSAIHNELSLMRDTLTEIQGKVNLICSQELSEPSVSVDETELSFDNVSTSTPKSKNMTREEVINGIKPFCLYEKCSELENLSQLPKTKEEKNASYLKDNELQQTEYQIRPDQNIEILPDNHSSKREEHIAHVKKLISDYKSTFDSHLEENLTKSNFERAKLVDETLLKINVLCKGLRAIYDARNASISSQTKEIKGKSQVIFSPHIKQVKNMAHVDDLEIFCTETLRLVNIRRRIRLQSF